MMSRIGFSIGVMVDWPGLYCQSAHTMIDDKIKNMLIRSGVFVNVFSRDSYVKILGMLDDVQALLDDHILKSQSMRGSPFIAALGKKATDWEEKLINMQDIMDVWVQVQSIWMYLEPIFSSDDIMRQMPVEGRNFKEVSVICWV